MAKVGVAGAPVLTPKQLQQTWQHLYRKFAVNVWNFEVMAGRSAVEIFQKSFDMKKFNSSGAVAWKRRSPNSKKTHPLMTETYSLIHSITWKQLKGKRKRGVLVFTDPKAFRNTNSHKGFCFAAVHNSDDNSIRRGRVANMPQRQFMPTESQDSTVMNDKLKELSRMIFQGFPQ